MLLVAAALGVIGGLLGIPLVVAALREATPVALLVLAGGLLFMRRLGASYRSVRYTRAASAWLLVASLLALPLVDGTAQHFARLSLYRIDP